MSGATGSVPALSLNSVWLFNPITKMDPSYFPKLPKIVVRTWPSSLHSLFFSCIHHQDHSIKVKFYLWIQKAQVKICPLWVSSPDSIWQLLSLDPSLFLFPLTLHCYITKHLAQFTSKHHNSGSLSLSSANAVCSLDSVTKSTTGCVFTLSNCTQANWSN